MSEITGAWLDEWGEESGTVELDAYEILRRIYRKNNINRSIHEIITSDPIPNNDWNPGETFDK